MAFTDYIDLYCERLAPGLLGEPLNALSNVAFFVAAWGMRRALRRCLTGRTPGDLALLPILAAAIGVGSLLFHLLAVRWAAAVDTGFIALFMLTFAAIWAHRVLNLPWPRAGLGAPVFALFVAGVALTLPLLQLSWAPAALGLYLAAWLALGLLAGWSAARDEPGAARWLLASLAAFTISLGLRQLDLPLCRRWPAGTHFGWHLFNGLVLYCSARSVMSVRHHAGWARSRA